MSEIRGFESTFFTADKESGVAVVTMTRDRLTEEENLEQMDVDFRTLVDTFNLRQVALDLKSVEYITSSAIGKMITWHRQLSRSDGSLILSELHPEVSSILRTSHLLGYFNVCDTTAAAVSELAE